MHEELYIQASASPLDILITMLPKILHLGSFLWHDKLLDSNGIIFILIARELSSPLLNFSYSSFNISLGFSFSLEIFYMTTGNIKFTQRLYKTFVTNNVALLYSTIIYYSYTVAITLLSFNDVHCSLQYINVQNSIFLFLYTHYTALEGLKAFDRVSLLQEVSPL